MITAFILGILTGLDNLQVGSAFELMGLKREKRWRLAASFTFFEMTMPLVGAFIGSRLNSLFKSVFEWMGPCILLALGVYIVIRELMEKERKDLANQKWVLILLPFFMSLDNLIAGLGLGIAGYPVLRSAIIVGVCAGGMCLMGFFLGEKMRRFIPGKIEIVAGIYLIAMGIFWIVKD